MKYVKTDDGRIIDTTKERETFLCKQRAWCPEKGYVVYENAIVAQSDNIEELCDCFSYDTETTKDFDVARSWKLHNSEREIYGCLKTKKGLMYVAEFNKKGKLELL